MKPGWQTSEFWQTMLSQVLALCVLLGVVAPAMQPTLAQAGSAIIVAVFTILVNGSVVYHYLQTRLELKREQLVQSKTPQP